RGEADADFHVSTQNAVLDDGANRILERIGGRRRMDMHVEPSMIHGFEAYDQLAVPEYFPRARESGHAAERATGGRGLLFERRNACPGLPVWRELLRRRGHSMGTYFSRHGAQTCCALRSYDGPTMQALRKKGSRPGGMLATRPAVNASGLTRQAGL